MSGAGSEWSLEPLIDKTIEEVFENEKPADGKDPENMSILTAARIALLMTSDFSFREIEEYLEVPKDTLRKWHRDRVLGKIVNKRFDQLGPDDNPLSIFMEEVDVYENTLCKPLVIHYVNEPKWLKALIEHGANVKNYYEGDESIKGGSAIWFADNPESFRLILEAGAVANVWSPSRIFYLLEWVIERQDVKNKKECISLLVKHGASTYYLREHLIRRVYFHRSDFASLKMQLWAVMEADMDFDLEDTVYHKALNHKLNYHDMLMILFSHDNTRSPEELKEQYPTKEKLFEEILQLCPKIIKYLHRLKDQFKQELAARNQANQVEQVNACDVPDQANAVVSPESKNSKIVC